MAKGVNAIQIYDMLLESQGWPRNQMQAFQRSQLEQLLRHAKANVPFYKSRLDCVFAADDSIDWTRWDEIPVVTRADLRDRHHEMQALTLPPGHGPTKSYFSSGSSGVPIEYTTNHVANVFRGAAWRRFYALHGIGDDVRFAHFGLHYPDKTELTESAAWTQKPTPTGDASILLINRTLSPEMKLDVMAEHAIEVVYDFATSLVQLAMCNLERGTPVRLKAVVSFGMGLEPHEVETLRQSFGGRVLSAYSSKEAGLIAFSCPETENFHICDESVLVEPVPLLTPRQDRSGILVTPFFHTAQPLIRYDQGDVVSFGENCACGSCLGVLQNIHGRADTHFLFNGTKVPIVGVDDKFLISHLKAKALQIAQTGPLQLEVRYIANTTASETERRLVSKDICRSFGLPLKVSCRRLQQLPVNAGGKQNRYVREWNG